MNADLEKRVEHLDVTTRQMLSEPNIDSGARAVGEDILALIAAQREAEKENARLGDEIVDWQTASGLCVPAEEDGGDPSSVKPRHLAKYIAELQGKVTWLLTPTAP